MAEGRLGCLVALLFTKLCISVQVMEMQQSLNFAKSVFLFGRAQM